MRNSSKRKSGTKKPSVFHSEKTEYRYLGDRNTRAELKEALCVAVRNSAGKCIRGRNGAMLVSFKGVRTVVLGRRLRKVIPENEQPENQCR